MGSTAEQRGQRKKISELEDRITETAHPKPQRENKLEKKKKKNSIIRTCGIITKDLPFTSPDSRKKRKSKAEKVLEEIMAENIPNLARDINLKIQETGVNPKQHKSQKSIPTHIIIKFLEKQR